ncbi:MAG: MOSC domain-containing protein [Hydrococcus sp. Prado102]|nr:MOSC domain-containing protein [Hydrococcus sp. Prado102]
MINSNAAVGSVVSLWRYPVKSMLGEELNATQVTEKGLLGDHIYALIDTATGMTISAKNPRKWGKMFDCRAALAETSVKITLPDGAIVLSNADDANQILSQLFGRELKLKAIAPQKPSLEEYWPTIEGLPHQDAVTNEATLANTFFDGATVHILTTATLDRLQEITPNSRFETRRFRPNIVVKPMQEAKGFIENDWIGREIAIGDEVRLKVTGACPRCVMTTMAQSELPKDLSVLQTAVKHNQGNVGIYASVVRGGIVRRGDPVF